MPDKTCFETVNQQNDKTITSLSAIKAIITRVYLPKISNYMYKFVSIISMAPMKTGGYRFDAY